MNPTYNIRLTVTRYTSYQVIKYIPRAYVYGCWDIWTVRKKSLSLPFAQTDTKNRRSDVEHRGKVVSTVIRC